MFEVTRSFLLHASHQATWGEERCRNLHGHTFKVTLGCRTEELDDFGFSVDFCNFDPAIAKCIADFDHQHLNDSLVHPTCENLAIEIGSRVSGLLPELCWIEIEEVGIGTIRVWLP